MRAGSVSDHGSLALLAQNREAELRPLLLRVHVQNFVDAPRHDAAARASFEAIAFGLIPLVPDDVLADAAAQLRARPAASPAVLAALESRLARRDDEASADPPSSDTDAAGSDLRLARDRHAALGGDVLAGLVERAIRDPDLAKALLERPEPTAFDRAALYRHAGPDARGAIRRDLALALVGVHQPHPAQSGAMARGMLDDAARGDLGGMLATISRHLGVAPAAFDLADPVGRELFVFALLAVGLDEAECVRALILLGTPQSRSVSIVFELADLARTTSRPVAIFLAGYERLSRHRPAAEPASPGRASGQLRADGRTDPIVQNRRPDRVGRDRAPIVRIDRRS